MIKIILFDISVCMLINSGSLGTKITSFFSSDFISNIVSQWCSSIASSFEEFTNAADNAKLQSLKDQTNSGRQLSMNT